MVLESEGILSGISDLRHIERERAKNRLELALKFASSESTDQQFENELTTLTEGTVNLLKSESWEARMGGLVAAKLLMQFRRFHQLENTVLDMCMQLLEDEEVRVRLAVGDCVQILGQLRGSSVPEFCMERILLSIQENYDRLGEGSKASRGDSNTLNSASTSGAATPTASRPNSRNSSVGDLIGMLLQSSYKVTKPGSGELRHGTEGWGCLETSCRCLGQMLEGCGSSCKVFLTPDFLQLVSRSQLHPNRFVREVSHYMVATLSNVLGEAGELPEAGAIFLQPLADGLSDNWSQVRYAASVATRTFLKNLGRENRDPALKILLPPMCLNRYYEADGVRMYSQQTWREVMGEEGRTKVALFVSEVVSYYIAQSKASHHGVREAACGCIAELMEKVDRSSVAAHVESLLQALTVCFKDMGWPVRDAACAAFGRCVQSHPEETWPVLEKGLWDLWFSHLWDNVPSVRRNSAIAVGNAVRVYGTKALPKVVSQMRSLLPMALQQPCDQHTEQPPLEASHSGLSSTGRIRHNRQADADNDRRLHSDQEMFSCTTLTSRSGKDYYIKSDGCMDYGFSRERDPWEASDGALHLMEQLLLLPTALAAKTAAAGPHCYASDPTQWLPEVVSEVLGIASVLPDLAMLRSFQKAHNLRETLWKCLPGIARGVGKQKFKVHLEGLLAPMFADLTCGYQLTEAAAGRCVVAMKQLLGSTMFVARLDPNQQELMRSNMNVILAENESRGGGY
ncbi:hypothetical protein CEUSTIGMA_g1268.t1 [Chlamydomonas eustigma]|uniref:Dynein axonemal assembly factor 5 TPR repeats domain-containing protein n=1 Tax=Chlamydomonas eustigma TaxID=1157962 RepID=A0A250WSK8_9CHLO|nr:hypothetical protein CEUSTIGMA_g1268.t1 [Chlamydomonas eustigma]|eukprot:GAX73817.1 hypothetical protein CEUSTIGMA_g1268.t1 [Chlamydomonas eustigma]